MVQSPTGKNGFAMGWQFDQDGDIWVMVDWLHKDPSLWNVSGLRGMPVSVDA